MKDLQGSKKGFFFVLVVFILLSYILVSTTSWMKAIEVSEKAHQERIKFSTLQLIGDQISNDTATRFASMAAKYALYTLVNHTVENPLKAGTPIYIETEDKYDIKEGDELQSNLRSALQGLINSGKADKYYFSVVGLDYSSYGEESASFSFKGWKDELNDSMSKAGFELLVFEVQDKDFTVEQTSINYVEINMTINITVGERNFLTTFNKNLNVSVEIPLEGLADPYIQRGFNKIDPSKHIFKQFFLAEDKDTGGILEISKDSHPFDDMYFEDGEIGYSWFYGRVFEEGNDAEDLEEGLKADSILVIDVEQLFCGYKKSKYSYFQQFGAYIIDYRNKKVSCDYGQEPEALEWWTELLQKPFVFIDYKDWRKMDDDLRKPDKGIYSSREGIGRLLFIASRNTILFTPSGGEDFEASDEVYLYDIEDFRDLVVCSYYFMYPEGPSFIQRMSDRPDDQQGGSFGIATTVVGRWAGGDTDLSNNERSRLDVEFIEDTGTEVMIRGLPGCLNPTMCEEQESPVGEFKLSRTFLKYIFDYDRRKDPENIGCDNRDLAECEE